MERLDKVLEKIERKKGILVVKEEDEVRFIKEIYWEDNGDRSWAIRKFYIDETEDKFDIVEKRQLVEFIKENLDKIEWFGNENEFWNWFKNCYKDMKGEEVTICDIEESLEGLEEKKGILVVCEKDGVKFIKNFGDETRIKFNEISLWFDGRRDDVYKWEDIYDEEEVIEGISDRMRYFKSYKDFVKWVVNCLK